MCSGPCPEIQRTSDSFRQGKPQRKATAARGHHLEQGEVMREMDVGGDGVGRLFGLEGVGE